MMDTEYSETCISQNLVYKVVFFLQFILYNWLLISDQFSEKAELRDLLRICCFY